MSTRKAHSSVTTEVNNGGAAINVGTLASDSPLSKSLKSSDDTVTVFGSTVSTVSADVRGITAGGAVLNTVASIGELYETPVQPVKNSVHKLVSQKIADTTTQIRAGKFNSFGISAQTSNFSVVPSGVTTAFNETTSGDTPIDQAVDGGANGTGELTFNLGGAKPSGVDYAAKTT
tara:strand:- start:878 stop:1402 length:525 start_codon:yes stop_codon:yes gene_type:complete